MGYLWYKKSPVTEVTRRFGGRSGARTPDPLIKRSNKHSKNAHFSQKKLILSDFVLAKSPKKVGYPSFLPYFFHIILTQKKRPNSQVGAFVF
nr:MAG TPA: hypothetical protein [Caudoviricetes sp.]